MRMQSVKTIGGVAALLALGTAGVLLQPTRAQSIAGGADNAVTENGESGEMPSHAQCQRRQQKSNGQNRDEENQDSRPLPPPSPEEMMIAQLELTPDQQTQVKAIFETEREQMRIVHQQTQQLLSQVLTDTQLQQLSTMPSPPLPRPRQDSQNQGRQQGSSNPASPNSQ